MKKEHVKLSETDYSYLITLMSKGEQKARTFRRASALLQLNEGSTLQAVAKNLKVSPLSIFNLRNNYLQHGLDCLFDRPRSGRPVEFDGKLRAKLTALACTVAPKGRAHWSLNLLADKMVELEYCEKISRSTVNQILKKTS